MQQQYDLQAVITKRSHLKQKRLPYIRPMFYAARDIKKGEELTWTYNNPKTTGESSRTGRSGTAIIQEKAENRANRMYRCSTNEFGGNIDEGEGYECFVGNQTARVRFKACRSEQSKQQKNSLSSNTPDSSAARTP